MKAETAKAKIEGHPLTKTIQTAATIIGFVVVCLAIYAWLKHHL